MAIRKRYSGKNIHRDWGFVFQAMVIQKDDEAKDLFVWKLESEKSIHDANILLNNPVSTDISKLNACKQIIELRKEEKHQLKKFLKFKRPSIYLDTVRKTRKLAL